MIVSHGTVIAPNGGSAPSGGRVRCTIRPLRMWSARRGFFSTSAYACRASSKVSRQNCRWRVFYLKGSPAHGGKGDPASGADTPLTQSRCSAAKYRTCLGGRDEVACFPSPDRLFPGQQWP